MRKVEELKKILTEVKNNEYSIPESVDLDELIEDMLKNIGHTDSELRDGLIYKVLANWCENGVIPTEKVRYIFNTCLGEDYLFLNIGEKDTDSVFTRAFAMLMIPVAFCTHDETPFLTDAEISNIKKAVFRYVKQEKDYRGWVDGKGWAHAIAHAADAIDNIVFVCTERDDFIEIFDAIKEMVSNKDVVYDAGEDERIAGAVIAAIYQSVCDHEILTSKDICTWIESFGDMEKEWWNGAMPYDYYLHANRKNFMKSLYVKLLLDEDFDEHKDDYDEICKCVFDVLGKMFD